MRVFEYKMVQVPPSIVIRGRRPKGGEAAAWLEDVTNRHAATGWEFYRVDPIGVDVKPGCFGTLLGRREEQHVLYVITFRKPR